MVQMRRLRPERSPASDGGWALCSWEDRAQYRNLALSRAAVSPTLEYSPGYQTPAQWEGRAADQQSWRQEPTCSLGPPTLCMSSPSNCSSVGGLSSNAPRVSGSGWRSQEQVLTLLSGPSRDGFSQSRLTMGPGQGGFPDRAEVAPGAGVVENGLVLRALCVRRAEQPAVGLPAARGQRCTRRGARGFSSSPRPCDECLGRALN